MDDESGYDELVLWFEHDLFDQLNHTVTIVAVVATITLVATVACLRPASRASRENPKIVLRDD